MNTAFYIFLAFYLASLIIRTTYEVLKEADRLDPKSNIIFLGILLDMILMWASWFYICTVDPLRVPLPGIVRWAGLVALIIGWVLGLGALIQLKGVENIDHLVISGLFSKIRHPMYTGFVLWIPGWAIYQGAGISLIAGLVGIGNVIYWRHLEELKLEACYGDVYRNYRRKTWF